MNLDETPENDPDVTVEDTNSDTEVKNEETVTVDLYVANAGKGERTGGPYLDDVERHNAETWRAQREGREPDYENPPATAGTVLVPKSQLIERDTDKAHFSDNVEVTNKPYTTVEVQVPSTEPDPAQPDFDNDYDRLKAYEARQRLNEVDGNTNKRADSNASVAESLTTEERLNSAANKPSETDSEGFTGAEDAGDHIDTETTGDNWGNSDDTINSGVTGDGANH